MSPVRTPVVPAASAVALALGLGTLSSGCVTKVRYDQLVAQSARAQLEAEGRQKAAQARVEQLEAGLAAAEAATQDRDARLSDLSTQSHNLQAQLDEQTAMNEQLRGELGRLGKDVDKVLQDKGVLAKALDEAKVRLDELRKAQAAGEARVALFRDFERRFKPLIDGGQLAIETRRGQLAMVVQGDLLFEAGHSDVRSAGKGVLMEIARTLQVDSGPGTAGGAARRYLVTAHVDPVAEVAQAGAKAPESKARQRSVRLAEARKATPRGRSAWEISVEQAAAVVEYLVSLGVPAGSLTAAGAGSYDPAAPGDDPEARAKDRRIEFTLLPSGDDGTLASAPR